MINLSKYVCHENINITKSKLDDKLAREILKIDYFINDSSQRTYGI